MLKIGRVAPSLKWLPLHGLFHQAPANLRLLIQVEMRRWWFYVAIHRYAITNIYEILPRTKQIFPSTTTFF